MAFLMAFATNLEVPGCASCAFTTTGQPAAKAEAVSPPATENANGKLLAPKTRARAYVLCLILGVAYGLGLLYRFWHLPKNLLEQL